ncbi:P-loop containing nucleoside triphosphate hydrolase protein [Scheffersomyces coipomensis]|uniref:P-loop containing nucleoside triphosphate hydrolase protein n=1 Tax=Scheffersomyces coipomensis TaxID=1788519 RepID=UPI00315CAC38
MGIESDDGSDSGAGNNIKVLVRVRPLLRRELEANQDQAVIDSLITMPPEESKRVILRIPEDSTYHSQKNKTLNRSNSPGEEYKSYYFDETIWSYNRHDDHYCDNKQFYQKTGPQLVDHVFQGYNVCLLAYGQTSSGKTYTMMGEPELEELGLVPRIVRDIMRQREVLVSEKINCEVKMSYVEIYNEQVKDLLDVDNIGKSNSNKPKLRVREHPVSGPYIENVVESTLHNYDDFTRHLENGNLARSTAATSMNDKSSRSHAIITITLKQTKFGSSEDSESEIGEAEEEMISNIKLVDLAGSERLSKTKVFGQQDRIKEGSQINKSLTVLGRCINILSSETNHGVVPYRDSVLTYILKENLAGNSKSYMIFCVSPIDFEETYQTLNYANQVKSIKTAARANKIKLASIPIDWEEMKKLDQDAIDLLKLEVESLTARLQQFEFESETSNSLQKEMGKYSNTINFLERELNQLRFENKYLKLQSHKQTQQINEINKYAEFVTTEYDSLHGKYQSLQQYQFEHDMKRLQDHSHTGLQQLESMLDIYDPKNTF